METIYFFDKLREHMRNLTSDAGAGQDVVTLCRTT